MKLVPPAVVTLATAVHHLQIGPRRAQALLVESHLDTLAKVALGQSRGTYRLIPELGIGLMRQMQSPSPRQVDLWRQAITDVVSSPGWHNMLASLKYGIGRPDDEAMGIRGSWIETVLRSASMQPVMEELHETTMGALTQYGLDRYVQVETMLVDRLESEEEAVVLVGPQMRAYLLPRDQLRIAGIDREKAWGVIVATRTGRGVDIDVWPAIGLQQEDLRPDPELWSQRVEVGR